MNVPNNLFYAKTHEWARKEGNKVYVGITDHAQHEITDIVHVELPETGKSFDKEHVHIDILSAGALVSNPSELINSKYFVDLLKELKDDYDLVLLDCPPISNLTDGILVSKLVDGTVYIVEADRLDRELVLGSIEELISNKSNVLGAVLTKVDIKKEKKKYGYKYDYYYSNYNR